MPDKYPDQYPEELHVLAENKTRLTYFQGETIYKQGAFAPYVLYIVEGLAKISLETGPNKYINLRLAQKGDFLALGSLFGEKRYQTTALALRDTQTCMIDKESFSKILESNPAFAIQVSAQNHQQEKRILELVRSLSYNQMRGKLASTLLYLNALEYNDAKVFELLTRQEIAAFAGIAQESAVKFLKEFEHDGILSLKGKQILIHQENSLQNLAING